MNRRALTLDILPETYAVCRLEADGAIPEWAGDAGFVAITRTASELSVVCPQDAVPATVRQERRWRCLQVAGPLDFTLTGVLASLADPLAAVGIPIFAVSTFETDYVLVKDDQLSRAVLALAQAGHRVRHPITPTPDDGSGGVSIEPLTEKNWRDALALSVRDDQANLVAGNAYSLAQSRFHPDWTPAGIFAGDAMVGFTMWDRESSKPRCWIIRFMIGSQYQGHGYGKAGLRALIDRFHADPSCREIMLSVAPQNVVATKLYESAGFERTGAMRENGEVVMHLRLQ